VVFLRVVGSKSNDARMTRWPLSFTAARCYTNSGDTTRRQAPPRWSPGRGRQGSRDDSWGRGEVRIVKTGP
jgi:hypothetical protein